MPVNELLEASRLPYAVLEREAYVYNSLFTYLTLRFDMEAQTQSNWCWAATSKSVSRFYRPSTTWTQCRIASAELGRTDCCTSPVPSPCNVPWYLDRALTRTRNFVSFTGPATGDQIRAELRAGRVVGARVGWSGGGGHFMVIFGISRVAGVDYLDIDDPIYGKSQPSFATFQTAYQGSGSWTTSYFTQREPFVIKLKPFLLREPFLKKIWEMRPLIDLKAGLAPARAPEDLATTLAHPVYVVGLDELAPAPAAGRGRARRGGLDITRASRSPVAVRVIERRGEQTSAFFDVNLDESDPQVLQASGAGPYLAQLSTALASALAWLDKAEGSDRELRLLRVPALYVDALWLHGDKAGEDAFVPVHAPFLGLESRVYPATAFLAALRQAAAQRRPDDDQSGA